MLHIYVYIYKHISIYVHTVVLTVNCVMSCVLYNMYLRILLTAYIIYAMYVAQHTVCVYVYVRTYTQIYIQTVYLYTKSPNTKLHVFCTPYFRRYTVLRMYTRNYALHSAPAYQSLMWKTCVCVYKKYTYVHKVYSITFTSNTTCYVVYQVLCSILNVLKTCI